MKTRYQCERCAKHYDTTDEAAECEEYCRQEEAIRDALTKVEWSLTIEGVRANLLGLKKGDLLRIAAAFRGAEQTLASMAKESV